MNSIGNGFGHSITFALQPSPWTPQPQTQNPTPKTLKPETQNPKILNPQPQTVKLPQLVGSPSTSAGSSSTKALRMQNAIQGSILGTAPHTVTVYNKVIIKGLLWLYSKQYNRATLKGFIYPYYECYSTATEWGQYPSSLRGSQ